MYLEFRKVAIGEFSAPRVGVPLTWYVDRGERCIEIG